MDAKVIEMKEGDIFRWRYRDLGNDGAWGRYHGCSNIAVVRNGRLVDTFWTCSTDGHLVDPAEAELTLLGNFSELVKADEFQADYYDPPDVVNLNHSNSTRGNFYLRKGAKRSAERMLEAAQYKLERARSDEKTARMRAERIEEMISQIKSGKIDAVYF